MRSTVLFRTFVLFALVSLSACVPGLTPALQAPAFSSSGEVQVVSFSPPLVGRGALTLRLPLEVYNPNNFELELTRVDFDLLVNERLALTSAFTNGFGLSAQGSRELLLDVTVPLEAGLELLSDVVNLVGGQSTRYRLDGRVSVEVLGLVEVFAKTTLVSGQIN